MNVAAVKSSELNELNRKFEHALPAEIVRWASERFRPKLAATSSFQTESVVLLHLISGIDPSLPILFLETGWHFPETLEFKAELVRLFGLTNVIDLNADPQKKEAFDLETSGKPYEQDPDRCCYLNKVEPLERALKDYSAWLSGIRRSQSKMRQDIRIIEEYQNGLIKVNPLANMTSGDIWWYIKEHRLPVHPLWSKGYLSIGCWPCTRPAQPGDDERSGRWAGREKTECGIHTLIKPKHRAPSKERPEDKEEGGGI